MRVLQLLVVGLSVTLAAALAQAQTSANVNAGASVSASATAPQYYNGYWWYRDPGTNQWSYWRNNQWNAYVSGSAAANFQAGASGYRYYNGMWWYQHPGTNTWSYYRNNQWNVYSGANLGARIGGSIAGAPGANLGANIGAAVTGQARFHNGYWWYPGPNNQWQVWNGSSWMNYTPGMRISGYSNYGFRNYGDFRSSLGPNNRYYRSGPAPGGPVGGILRGLIR